ncbi:hypothetical protein LSTR_LSTR010297 [Laodelphax striatellus]|uniref:Osiris 16 n=1 Tax=Laodelphax striatellus TaxID=195883 RepID=A0A482XRM5_LAOST|nr:hypothetical protein LSTR_LSTR010297 [Laodelphax striatellus]
MFHGCKPTLTIPVEQSANILYKTDCLSSKSFSQQGTSLSFRMRQIHHFLIFLTILSTVSCALKEDTLEIDHINSSNRIGDVPKKETIWNSCSNTYSKKCLKESISKILARFNKNNHLELFPGVSLAWSPVKAELTKPLYNKTSSLENALVRKISKYLSSISLKIQLIDANALSNSKSFSDIFGLDTAEGGRKRKDNGAIWAMAMVMGGSMLSMALAGVAAAAAKALTMSIVAAALSALAALKGGDKSTTYEVISRPVVSHAHTYSSEVQHEHAGHGHGHYKRSIDQANIPQNMMFRNYMDSR